MRIFYIIDKKIILIFFIVLSITLFSYYLDQLTMPSNSSNMLFKIAIDPGHGSIDTGTHYNSLYEKDINLSIAKYLEKSLKKSNIITVMTRTDDSLYKKSRIKDLRNRPIIAKEENVDLYISLHVNNFPSSSPEGSQVFYKRNSEKSELLAEYIKESLVKINSANNRESKSGDYYVLNKVNCPAVLIEAGFLSNKNDRENLKSEKYKKEFAHQIKEGIISYLNESLKEKNYKNYIENEEDQQKVFSDSNIYNDLSIYFLNKSYDNLKLVKKDFIYPTGSFLNENISELSDIEFIALYALRQLSEKRNGLINPLIDKNTIKNVEEKNGTLIINLSDDIRKKFQGGSFLELKTIEAIYKSLYSIPDVKKVEIKINGLDSSTIGGHIILPE